MSLFALGIGIGTKDSEKNWMEVFYPTPLLHPSEEMTKKIATLVGYTQGNKTINLDSTTCHALEALCVKDNYASLAMTFAILESCQENRVLVFLEEDLPLQNVPEAYLKLHLLSHRLVRPHQVDLTNIFSLLPTVAWTNIGPIDIKELATQQFLVRTRGSMLQVNSIDKFPKMTDYVVPSQIRIADTARIRLGAYLGEGTTVMHEGFINFNAGTIGPNMVEGRISSGVVIDKETDLGGGCSTMGTLSGGGTAIISVGKNCLIGANAGIGISLGDCCTVEAGLYITAGSKVTMIDEKGKTYQKVARDLSGENNLLFRRNSQTGILECLEKPNAVSLNDELHKNN